MPELFQFGFHSKNKEKIGDVIPYLNKKCSI